MNIHTHSISMEKSVKKESPSFATQVYNVLWKIMRVKEDTHEKKTDRLTVTIIIA